MRHQFKLQISAEALVKLIKEQVIMKNEKDLCKLIDNSEWCNILVDHERGVIELAMVPNNEVDYEGLIVGECGELRTLSSMHVPCLICESDLE